jgi:siroheme synthase
MSGNTPAVVAAAIGRPTQQIRIAALADLEKAAAGLDKSMPILIGMGEVFREPRNISMPSSRRRARWPSSIECPARKAGVE